MLVFLNNFFLEDVIRNITSRDSRKEKTPTLQPVLGAGNPEFILLAISIIAAFILS